MTSEPEFPEAELARLADGSLPSARQAELRARVRQSPELERSLAEQERMVTMLRAVDVTAPEALRARIQELATGDGKVRATDDRGDGTIDDHVGDHGNRAERWRPRFRLRFALPMASGLTAAAVALVVLIILSGGSSGPSLSQAARVAVAAATTPAPAADTTDPTRLTLSVAGIPFPNWGRTVGWKAVGARSDTLAGRRVQTVFYAWHPGDRVGYAIVPGSPVPVSGGHAVTEGGVRYTLVSEGSTRVVTWVRSGHTCVIAGRGVSGATLLSLALAD